MSCIFFLKNFRSFFISNQVVGKYLFLHEENLYEKSRIDVEKKLRNIIVVGGHA